MQDWQMRPIVASMKLGTVLGLLCLSGCGKPPEGAGGGAEAAGTVSRIVFVTNGDSPFWDAAQKGWEDEAAKLGLKATFLRNKTGDAAGQIRLLDQVLSQSDVRGVAVSVIEASAVGIIDRLRELRANGVEVVTVDSDCNAKDVSARKAYIGTNNHQAGKVAGEIAQRLLPQGGQVVGFVGTMDADNARQRVAGFKEGAGDKLKLVEVMEDQADVSKARENVGAALLKHKELAMPFGIYSYNAPAIAEEVASSGKRDKLKILTFDAEVNTMKAIQAGQIDATIVQNTYDMGAVSARLLGALIKKDSKAVEELLKGGDQIDTGVRIIVPDASALKGKDSRIQTHKEFEAYMQSKGLKST
jgi:ribose transport system substrate-binding protein